MGIGVNIVLHFTTMSSKLHGTHHCFYMFCYHESKVCFVSHFKLTFSLSHSILEASAHWEVLAIRQHLPTWHQSVGLHHHLGIWAQGSFLKQGDG